jgi:hypothetical protein
MKDVAQKGYGWMIYYLKRKENVVPYGNEVNPSIAFH